MFLTHLKTMNRQICFAQEKVGLKYVQKLDNN